MKELLTASPTQTRDLSAIVETEMEAMVEGLEADILDNSDIQPTTGSSKENQVHDIGIQASVDRKNARVQVKPIGRSIGEFMYIYMWINACHIQLLQIQLYSVVHESK